MTDETHKEKKLRGFAALSPAQRKGIARKGGAAVPKSKRSFSNKEIAARAGAIGGKAVSPEKRSFSIDRELAARSGRKGGKKKTSLTPPSTGENNVD